MKTLIVGEAPSRSSDPSRPLSGVSGARLAALAGLDVEAFLATFDRRNLFDAWPGRSSGKGSRFAPVDAERAARAVRPFGDRVVVLLGKRVARAFGVTVDYFVRTRIDAANVYVVPHPSRVVRWYNDPKNERQMADFMRTLAEETR